MSCPLAKLSRGMTEKFFKISKISSIIVQIPLLHCTALLKNLSRACYSFLQCSLDRDQMYVKGMIFTPSPSGNMPSEPSLVPHETKYFFVANNPH